MHLSDTVRPLCRTWGADPGTPARPVGRVGGWSNPTEQDFLFPFFRELAPADVAQVSPTPEPSSTILEIAEEMAELGINNRQQVRFAFWGAEESGLLGSEHYVDQLSDEQLQSIWANLNFDMVGSPNYVRFVYDGDGSAGRPARRDRL